MNPAPQMAQPAPAMAQPAPMPMAEPSNMYELDVPMSGIAATGESDLPARLSAIAEESGRGGDSLMGHLTAGEVVIPEEILNSSPNLKKMLAQEFADQGVEMDQYIVGSELNMINPETGQPEFFIKKIFKEVKRSLKKVFREVKRVAKQVAPFVLPFVMPAMLGALGAGLGGISGLGAFGTSLANAATYAAATPWLSAGIGSALGTAVAGGDSSDILKSFAIGGTLGGIGNKMQGGDVFGMKPGSTNPFTQNQLPGGEIGGTQTAVSTAAPGPKLEIGTPTVDSPLDLRATSGASTTTPTFDVTGGIGEGSSGINLGGPTNFNPQIGGDFRLSPNTGAKPSINLSGGSNYSAIPEIDNLQRSFNATSQQMVDAGIIPNTGITPTPANMAAGYDPVRAERLLAEGKNISLGADGTIKTGATGGVSEVAKKGYIENLYDSSGLGPKLDKVPYLGSTARYIAQNPVGALTVGGLATGAFTEEEVPSPEEVRREASMAPSPYDYLAMNPGLGLDFGAYFADPRFSEAARQGPDYRAMAGLNRGVMQGNVVPAKRAAGGMMNGPGTGTSDDIPAMLSDGEFVMTAKAVRGAGGGDRQRGAQRMYDMMNQFQRRA